MENVIPNREQMVEMLKRHDCTITFVKVDGMDRTGKFTLRNDALPVVEEKKEKKTRKENPEVLSVWDLDKEAWRGFRVDSVKGFTVIN